MLRLLQRHAAHTANGRARFLRRIPRAAALEFEGNILQDARASQPGFATRLKVFDTEATREGGGAASGDIVTVRYEAVLDGAGGGGGEDAVEEPLTFEVGASSVVGNPLFAAFDAAVRGLLPGGTAFVEAGGGAYDKGLLFSVPRTHPEVVRLEAAAPLVEGAVVVLANSKAAVLRRVGPDSVILDCNHPLAGQPLRFKLTLLEIDKAEGEEDAVDDASTRGGRDE